MKMKIMSRVISGAVALLLCAGLISGMMMTSFADGEEGTTEEPAGKPYASTDYANHADQFEAFMAEKGTGDVVTFESPEGYADGITTRVKFIVDGTVIKEKYSAKAFVMPFCGVDLKVDGGFLADIGGERIEIEIEKIKPIIFMYNCPKCTSTDKVDKDGNPTGEKYKQHSGTLDKYTHVEGDNYICPRCSSTFTLSEAGEPDHNQVVDGGISIIETDKHPVVGGYVFDIKIYSDGSAIKEFSTANGGIEATIKVGGEAISAAKAENSKAKFNVYAYLAQANTYENMEATIVEADGTGTFKIKDRGWFFIAADDPADEVLTIDQLIKKWAPVVVIAVVAVIAIVVVLLIVLKKKKAPVADAE